MCIETIILQTMIQLNSYSLPIEHFHRLINKIDKFISYENKVRRSVNKIVLIELYRNHIQRIDWLKHNVDCFSMCLWFFFYSTSFCPQWLHHVLIPTFSSFFSWFIPLQNSQMWQSISNLLLFLTFLFKTNCRNNIQTTVDFWK